MKLSNEQSKISRKNNNELRKKLGIKGKHNLVLHHTDPTLKYKDIDRYIQWREEDVVVLTIAEHNTIHKKGIRISDKAKENISKAMKNVCNGDHWKEAHSEAMKGRHWYHNDDSEQLLYNCPDGWTKGRLPKNK